MRLAITPVQKNKSRSLDDSMIPAINIVFLLLIFFMIAGHIEARNEQLQIPGSLSEQDLNIREIEIQVLADGNYLLNGTALSSDIAAALNEMALSKESVITLHIHRDLPASSLDPVLKSVRKLGIKQLLIATEQQP